MEPEVSTKPLSSMGMAIKRLKAKKEQQINKGKQLKAIHNICSVYSDNVNKHNNICDVLSMHDKTK